MLRNKLDYFNIKDFNCIMNKYTIYKKIYYKNIFIK